MIWGASTCDPMVPLLLHHHLILPFGSSLCHAGGAVIFNHCVTIATCYTEGLRYYGDVVSVSQFLPADAMAP